METLERFIHPGPWTIADVEALPETGSRFEILAPGVLTVSPAARHVINALPGTSPACFVPAGQRRVIAAAGLSLEVDPAKLTRR